MGLSNKEILNLKRVLIIYNYKITPLRPFEWELIIEFGLCERSVKRSDEVFKLFKMVFWKLWQKFNKIDYGTCLRYGSILLNNKNTIKEEDYVNANNVSVIFNHKDWTIIVKHLQRYLEDIGEKGGKSKDNYYLVGSIYNVLKDGSSVTGKRGLDDEI